MLTNLITFRAEVPSFPSYRTSPVAVDHPLSPSTIPCRHRPSPVAVKHPLSPVRQTPIPADMSEPSIPPPRKVQARNIDEKKAPPHDLLITYASSLVDQRLLPLPDWLRAGCPTGDRYKGPRPTYQLVFDWSNLETEGPVAAVRRAVDECFGARNAPGWRIWIRGDQLVLLMQDFRKEYLRIKALKHRDQYVLDNYLLDLLHGMKTA